MAIGLQYTVKVAQLSVRSETAFVIKYENW